MVKISVTNIQSETKVPMYSYSSLHKIVCDCVIEDINQSVIETKEETTILLTSKEYQSVKENGYYLETFYP